MSDIRDVIVVEDEEDIREIIAEYLELDGVETTTYRNGGDALARLRARNRPALVVLDIEMPDVDGLAVIRSIAADAELAARVVVIVMTAHRASEKLSDPPPCVVGWLRKPLDFVQLRELMLEHRDRPERSLCANS